VWRTQGLWADLTGYVLRRPARPTRVPLPTVARRGDYDDRILQRLGIRVHDYSVLNIHRVGIEAPTALVWETVTRWRPDGGYWPNTLARAEFARHLPRHVEILLLGHIPLFQLDFLRWQTTPGPTDVDNARYLIYRCRGGYPMGVLSIYVRSRIEAEDEVEPTQLFFVVSFDFFGRKNWLNARLARPLWEAIHNRVTGHSLIRFKAHCEAGFAAVQTGAHSDLLKADSR
jgi:hypothetical protein